MSSASLAPTPVEPLVGEGPTIYTEHSHGSPAPSAIPSVRDARLKVSLRDSALASFPLPTGREEEWRFTPMPRLRGLHDAPAPGPIPTPLPGPIPGPTPRGGGKVVVEVDAEAPVLVEGVSRQDARLGLTGSALDRAAAQAWASFDTATVISIPAEAVIEAPVVVTIRGEGADASYGHLLIDLAPFAVATVVLECTGSATYGDNVEVRVGDGASLTLVSLYDWADDTAHVSSHSLRVGRDARLRAVTISLGGDLVRVSPTVTYAGPGGDAELLGLYFADHGQHLEHRLFVDHAVPSCKSNVLYKGALQGAEAHTVWIGDVLIRAAAEGTDTYEHNRNLLLTEGARADSVPNLEIETGEIVGAGHASASGRFDDEQLFYFMSRGIPEVEARRLVVRGFFAELVQKIGVPAVEERVMAALEVELTGTAGADAAEIPA